MELKNKTLATLRQTGIRVSSITLIRQLLLISKRFKVLMVSLRECPKFSNSLTEIINNNSWQLKDQEYHLNYFSKQQWVSAAYLEVQVVPVTN